MIGTAGRPLVLWPTAHVRHVGLDYGFSVRLSREVTPGVADHVGRRLRAALEGLVPGARVTDVAVSTAKAVLSFTTNDLFAVPPSDFILTIDMLFASAIELAEHSTVDAAADPGWLRAVRGGVASRERRR